MSTIGLKTSRLITSQRFRASVLLKKFNTGSYVDGRYIAGTEVLIPLQAHYQPVNDDTRENLEGGERIREAVKVWIKSADRDFIRPLRQGDPNSSGDILVINGLDYEVYTVNNYTLNQHIEVTAMRIENQNG